MKLLLQKGKLFFSAIKAICLPIIKDILSFIIASTLININNLNLNIAYKVAWIDFI